jgi:hypothetical protein
MTERRVTLQIVKPLEAIGRRQAQGHTVVNRISPVIDALHTEACASL